jgi:hypothetical protein
VGKEVPSHACNPAKTLPHSHTTPPQHQCDVADLVPRSSLGQNPLAAHKHKPSPPPPQVGLHNAPTCLGFLTLNSSSQVSYVVGQCAVRVSGPVLNPKPCTAGSNLSSHLGVNMCPTLGNSPTHPITTQLPHHSPTNTLACDRCHGMVQGLGQNPGQ